MFSVMKTDIKRETRSINNFDQLRLFLATLVIFSHSYLLLNQTDPVFWITRERLDAGALGVYGFFIVSGFLVSKSWIRSNGYVDFARKRALRIYPGLLCAMLVSLFLFGPLGGCHLPEMLADKTTYLFIYRPLMLKEPWTFIPSFCPTNYLAGNLNAPLWSIRWELCCYVMVVVLGVFNAIKMRWVVPILLAITLYGAWLIPQPLSIPYFGYVSNVPILVALFLSGTIFYQFKSAIPIKSSLAVFSLLVLGVATSSKLFLILLPIFGTYVLMYLAYQPRLHFRGLTRYGDFSYGLYLYGFPIQQVIIHSSTVVLDPLLLFVVSWTMSLMFAALSWHVVEKPFLKLKVRSSKLTHELSKDFTDSQSLAPSTVTSVLAPYTDLQKQC